MRPQLLLCLLLLFAGQTGMAQKPYSLNPAGETYIRFAPLGLIDLFDGNLSLGGEYRLNKIWSVNMDAGYVFYSARYSSDSKASGILLRPAIRAYISQSENIYMEMQFHYKNVMYHIHDWIGRDAVNGVASYEENTTFRYHRQVAGVHVITGTKMPLTKDHRFWIELYFGVGVHYRWQQLYHEPNSIYNGRDVFSPNDQRGSAVPALPAGLRLLYLIP